MIYIRAEGNAQIGMGHLMRSMSIASKLHKKVKFLVSTDEAYDVVKSKEFNVERLKTKMFSISEAENILSLSEGDDDVIVLDSYLYNNEYVLKLKKKFYVICMDDLIEDIYDADMIINYNTYADEDKYVKLYADNNINPRFITGGQYVPLRDEFNALPKNYKTSVGDILITTGGGDIDNYAKKIACNILKDDGLKSVNLHIVSGSFNKHYQSLAELEDVYSNVKIHKNVSNMCELIDSCDLAVSAAGSTCYEICSRQIPFAVFGYADNQKRILEDMQDKGTALSAGMIGNISDTEDVINNIVKNLVKLKDDEKLRVNIHNNQGKLIDGLGAVRLASVIENI